MPKKQKCLWRSEQHSRHKEVVVMPTQPRAYGVLSPLHSPLDRAAVAEQDTCPSRLLSAGCHQEYTSPVAELWPLLCKASRVSRNCLKSSLSTQLSDFTATYTKDSHAFVFTVGWHGATISSNTAGASGCLPPAERAAVSGQPRHRQARCSSEWSPSPKNKFLKFIFWLVA